MRRREFVTLFGGIAGLASALTSASWPYAARAEQGGKLPVIGFLSSRTPEQGQYLLAALRTGLQETGYVEGHNVVIEYRWANGQVERLAALAAELVARHVDVVVAGGTPGAARAAITAIPVVFTTGIDPVAYGLVSSINRPEGNLTGVTFYSGALIAKQFELLRAFYPRAATFGLLVKPDSPSGQPQVKDAQLAARESGIELKVVNARDESEFEPAFTALAASKNAAMLVSVDPYFDSRVARLVELAARHAIPTIYTLREFVEGGGLMNYGASITDAYRQAGAYAGRILKGAKPGDLPVLLPTKFELVINLKTAKVLGITVPQSLLVTADAVIE